MINISPNGLKHLKRGGLLGITIDCSGLDGNLTLTQSNIVTGSFSIERNSVSSQNIEIGNAETTEVVFVINNSKRLFDTYRFEGAELTIYFDVNGESIKAGVFIVDSPPKKLNTIKIRALDKMAKFNKLYTPSLVGSATLLSILQDCCAVCNVTLYTQAFLNDDYIATIPSGDSLTFHQVIIWIAELAGANAWMNENGNLVLSWYGVNSNNVELNLSASERFSYECSEQDIEITGLVVTKSDNVDYVFGTTEYTLTIEDNELLNYADINTIVVNVYNAINGYTYRPFKFATLGLPYIFPMDVVTIIDSVGVSITSIITNHKYVLNQKSMLEAKGETAQITGYATSAPFTAKQKRIIRDVAILEASTQVDNMTQATFNFSSLMTNSMGYYETITGDSETGFIRYIHDKPLLVDSDYIYMQSNAGFAYTITGWNGGSPVWSSGMTADGNILGKVLDVIGIRANWIKTGILKGLVSERIQFDLDNDTLTIGYHLLDIENDTLAFTSSVTDDKLDYLFQKSVAGTTCDMRVDGTFDTTVAFTWGDCRAERRDEATNEGIDFCF